MNTLRGINWQSWDLTIKKGLRYFQECTVYAVLFLFHYCFISLPTFGIETKDISVKCHIDTLSAIFRPNNLQDSIEI